MEVYTYRKVVRRGKKDGRNWRWKLWPFIKQSKPQIPRPDQTEPASYEVEIIRAVENIISEIAESWKQLDQKLKSEYCQSLNMLENLTQIFEKEAGESQAALRDFNKAKEEYEKVEHPSLEPRWRNFWLAFIAIAEFPLNSVVFALFGAGRLDTYIMAAGLCVAIPVLAHFFGQSLRQEYKSKTDKALLISTPIIMLLILGAIAFIRSEYFKSLETYQLLGVEISAFTMTILFIIINVAIFMVAVVISYEGSHPSIRSYKNIMKRYKEALLRLQKEDREAKVAGKELVQAQGQFQRIRQKRLKKHQQYLQRANTLKEKGEWLAQSYRAANLRVRHDYPECFKTEIKSPEIPQELLVLDWDCPEPEFRNQSLNFKQKFNS